VILGVVEEAVKAGARLDAACEMVGISVRTFERWRERGGGDDLRAGPKTSPANKLSAAERRRMLELVNSPEFCDLPPNQIVPKLADRGIYVCSEATMYRVLKEEKQLGRRDRAQEPKSRRPAELIATGPGQVWSWDITYLRGPVRGVFFYLYMVLDVWSRKIVAWAVHESESMDHAAALIEEALKREAISKRGLCLHSDNGGPMKGSTMLSTLQRLGVMPSFSRPSVADDNPFSEALFRTLKYRRWYPADAFTSVAHARTWVEQFVGWYNEEHLHSAVKFIRPIDRHTGLEDSILIGREKVYAAARARNPKRWSGAPRNWKPVRRVCLNPSPGTLVQIREEAAA
jgi:transposase InsO family protein